MISTAGRRQQAGLTLIELLCVVGIIGILAGLLLVPAGRILSRMRAGKWANDASQQVQVIQEKLHAVLAGQTQFQSLTLNALESAGWITQSQVRFLRDRRVRFTPFSGADPEDLPVIWVDLPAGFLSDASHLVVTKGDLTRPPR